MTQRILISTGGSGGHVVPATILYDHLKDLFHVSMSTDYRGLKFLDQNKYNIEIFNINPISKNIFVGPRLFFVVALDGGFSREWNFECLPVGTGTT